MYSLKKKWRRMHLPEKIALLVGVPCAVILFLFALMHVFRIRIISLSVYMPLVILLMLSQCAQHWRKKRKISVISLCAAVFVAFAYALFFVF